MERLKLGTKYGDITRYVAAVLAAPQLQRDPSKNQRACELVLDFGGIGRGIAEDLSTRVLILFASTLPVASETNWKRRHLYNGRRKKRRWFCSMPDSIMIGIR